MTISNDNVMPITSDGIDVHIMTEAHFLAGEDARGALVLLDPDKQPCRFFLTPILDRGGLGLISDYMIDPFSHPDDVPKLTNLTGKETGDPECEPRPFISFAVSPRMGFRIRALAATGALMAKVTRDEQGRNTLTISPPTVKAQPPKRKWCAGAKGQTSSDTPSITITKEDIVQALRQVDVKLGDTLLMHSAVSKFGYVEGGIPTLLDAVREAVGPEGTVLIPAFSRPYRILGGIINKQWTFRPFEPTELSSLRWIGKLSQTFLRLHPDAPRSRHYTHAWTGWGPHAKECLAAQAPDASPLSHDSPPGKVLELGGKILFLGADLDSCTFLHYLEDEFNLPGLGPAIIAVKNPDGSSRDVAIPKHLPGHRTFYDEGEGALFFRRAKERGLIVKRATLGLGMVKTIDLEPLYRIGCELCREDPYVIIGKHPTS